MVQIIIRVNLYVHSLSSLRYAVRCSGYCAVLPQPAEQSRHLHPLPKARTDQCCSERAKNTLLRRVGDDCVECVYRGMRGWG